MSYAEYGSRIFYAGINTHLQVDQKDGFGHRLKMIESCLDNRAWSSDPIENIRYFRETTEQKNENSAGIILPNMTFKETENNDTEKDSKNLKKKSNKYEVLNCTHESRKKLKQDHYHGIIMNEDWNVMDCVFNPFYKLIDYKKLIFGESETIFTRITKKNNHPSLKLNNRKNSNFPKSITQDMNEKSISNQTKSNTDISFSLSSGSSPHEDIENEFLSNEVKNKIDNVMLKNKNDDDDNSNDSQISDAYAESEHSSEVESMIFALNSKNKNILNAKDIELSQLRKENSQLKLFLKDYDSQIKNLSDDHQNIDNLQKLITQSHDELNELKNEVMNGRKIIDQLKQNLEEKKKECDAQNQLLNNLKHDAIDITSIKNERDSLANTFKEITKLLENAGYHNQNLEEDIKNLLNNHKELITLKKNLELNCSENEAEITKMYSFIDEIHKQNESQIMIINKLNRDIEQKTNLLNQHEEKITLLTKQCQEKLEIEKSFYENESINKDCDQAFAKYFKQSLEKLNDLTNALKDAGDDVQKRKRDIDKLKKQIKANIQVFKDQFTKKNKENNFYRFRYEECQKIISQQIEEIENLKRVIYKLERKIIYKMELSISELHQEHNNLTRKIQNLTSCIHERNMKIEELENEKTKLLNRIDHTSSQLEEQSQQVDVLKKINSTFREKLDHRKKNIESIFSALQSIQFQIEKVHLVSLENRKVTFDEKHRKVDISIVNSKNCSYENLNNDVEDNNIMNVLNSTESFENKLSLIKDDINILSDELRVNIDPKNSSENLSIQIEEKSDSCDNIYEKEITVPEKISKQLNKSDEAMKDDNIEKPKNRLNTFSKRKKDLGLLFDKKGETHRNILKKQPHHYSEVIKSHYGSNIFSKSSETQSSDDKSDFLNEIVVPSSKMGNIKQCFSDNKHIISKQYNNVEKKSNESLKYL